MKILLLAIPMLVVLLAILALLGACSAPANYPDIVAASLKRCEYIPALEPAREIMKRSPGRTSTAIASDICEVVTGVGPANVVDVPLQGFRVR